MQTFTTLGDTNDQPPEALQGVSTDPSDSSVQLQNPPHPDLEAQIREIAAREGVTLPKTNPRAITSITIATRRRSSSPSPSTSPATPLSPASEPLHLTELSTGAVNFLKANKQLPPIMDEEDKTSQLASGEQRREDAVGGQSEEPPPSSLVVGREDVNIKNDSTPSFRRDDKLSVQDSSVSGQTTASSTSESPPKTGHISHVHLTLSPKANDHSLASAVTGLPRKEFVPLRHSSSPASSPDEGVGLSSPPEWCDNREPTRQRGTERADTSTLFKTAAPQDRMTSTSSRFFTPSHRAAVSPRPLTTESPGSDLGKT